MRSSLLYILLPSILLGCCRSAGDATPKRLAEAQAYYQQAADIQRKVSVAVGHLEHERNQINIQGRALSEAEQQRLKDIEALLSSYADFESQFQPPEGLISRKEVNQQRLNRDKILKIWEKLKTLN